MAEKIDKELTVQMALNRINAVQEKPISLSTMYNMIINGRLLAFRRGKACIRISESEIKRFLTENEDACTENF